MPSTNGHGPKRAILYARVSTDEQARSGYSLAQQLEALREYAAREGYQVIEEVSDPGQSGASLERPGMDRVRDLVAAGRVSVVLAHNRDRFAREPAYHYLLRKEFEEHGTKIRALNDRGTIPLKVSSRTAYSTSLPSTRGQRSQREAVAVSCVRPMRER
jgi:DNA invertase Pin-like site-specific DNA recombinase